MFLSCPVFIQLKNLGILCLCEKPVKNKAPFVIYISLLSGNNFGVDNESQALTMFFLTPNAISHHKKPCLTLSSFPFPVLVAPWALRATVGWVSWEAGPGEMLMSRKLMRFRKENPCRSGQREVWAVSLFLTLCSTF